MVIDFWRESAKIDIPHLHFVRCHSTMEERIATRTPALTPPSTFDTNLDLVNFAPVTQVLQARLCRADYTLGFATHL